MLDLHVVYRSLAASGASLVAFTGLSHEFVGAALFPWAPAVFGGSVGWHAVGLLGIVLGLLLFAGTLHLVTVPVVVLSSIVAALGVLVTTYAAVVHGQFHFFALALSLSGVLVAVCHPRAERERAT